MPPRAAKRTPGPGAKRGRAARAAPKTQSQPEVVAEVSVEVEEVPVEVREVVKIEEKLVEEKPVEFESVTKMEEEKTEPEENRLFSIKSE